MNPRKTGWCLDEVEHDNCGLLNHITTTAFDGQNNAKTDRAIFGKVIFQLRLGDVRWKTTDEDLTTTVFQVLSALAHDHRQTTPLCPSTRPPSDYTTLPQWLLHLSYTAQTAVTLSATRTVQLPPQPPLFPGPPGWAGARREHLDFMVQGKINRGRHTDHPAGRHSIRISNQCPPPTSPIFFTGRMPFLPPNQQRQSTEGN